MPDYVYNVHVPVNVTGMPQLKELSTTMNQIANATKNATNGMKAFNTAFGKINIDRLNRTNKSVDNFLSMLNTQTKNLRPTRMTRTARAVNEMSNGMKDIKKIKSIDLSKVFKGADISKMITGTDFTKSLSQNPIKIKVNLDENSLKSELNNIGSKTGKTSVKIKGDVTPSLNTSTAAGKSVYSQTVGQTYLRGTRAISTVGEKLSNFAGNMMMLGSYVGLADAKTKLIDTPARAETNMKLLERMGDSSATGTTVYQSVDRATDTLPISMQNVVQPLYAFKAASGATAQEISDIAPQFANFGASVLAMTGSEDLAETAMQKLSWGLQGSFAALDQYGITEESLTRTGKWNGDSSDVQGFMAAVTEVTGDSTKMMDTYTGKKSLVDKQFSRTGKNLFKFLEPGLNGIMDGFLSVDNALGGAVSGLGLIAEAGLTYGTQAIGLVGGLGTAIGSIGKARSVFSDLRGNGIGIGKATRMMLTGNFTELMANSEAFERAIYGGPASYGYPTSGVTPVGPTTPIYGGDNGKRSKYDSLSLRNQKKVDKQAKLWGKTRESVANMNRKQKFKAAFSGFKSNRMPQYHVPVKYSKLRLQASKGGLKGLLSRGRYDLGMSGRKVAQSRLGTGFKTLGSSITSVISSINPLSAAFGGLTIAGLALGGAFLLSYNHSQKFRDSVSRVSDKFQMLFTRVGGAVGNLFQSLGWSADGGLDGLAEGMTTLVDYVGTILDIIGDLTGYYPEVEKAYKQKSAALDEYVASKYGATVEAADRDLHIFDPNSWTYDPTAKNMRDQMFYETKTGVNGSSHYGDIARDRGLDPSVKRSDQSDYDFLQENIGSDKSGNKYGYKPGDTDEQKQWKKDQIDTLNTAALLTKYGPTGWTAFLTGHYDDLSRSVDSQYETSFNNIANGGTSWGPAIATKIGQGLLAANPLNQLGNILWGGDDSDKSSSDSSALNNQGTAAATSLLEGYGIDPSSVGLPSINWDTLPQDIGNALSSFDWGGALQGVLGGLNPLSSIGDMLSGVDLNSMVPDLSSVTDSFSSLIGGVDLGNMFQSLFTGLNPSEWFSGLFESFDVGSWFSGLFGGGSTASGGGGGEQGTTPTSGGGVSGVVSNATSVFDTISGIGQNFFTRLNTTALTGSTNAANQVPNAFRTATPRTIAAGNTLGVGGVSGLSSGLSGMSDTAGEETSAVSPAMKHYNSVIGGAGNAVGTAGNEGFGTGISGLDTYVSEQLESALATAWSYVEQFQAAFSAIGSSMSQSVSGSGGDEGGSPGNFYYYMEDQLRWTHQLAESYVEPFKQTYESIGAGMSIGFNRAGLDVPEGLSTVEELLGQNGKAEIVIPEVKKSNSISGFISKVTGNREVVINNTFNVAKIDSRERMQEVARTIVEMVNFNNETAGRNTDI